MSPLKAAIVLVVLIGVLSVFQMERKLATAGQEAGQEQPVQRLVVVQGKNAGELKERKAADPPPSTLPRVLATPATGCPTTRFVYFANTNGRHSNQVRALIHALHFAAYTNRTLVAPPFTQDKKALEVSELYDWAALQKYFCVVTEGDVFGKKGRRVSVGCLERKGIKNKIPRNPGRQVSCAESVAMHSREIPHVVQRAALLSKYDVLYFYETNYYKHLSPGCFWRVAEPSPPIAAELQRIHRQWSHMAAALHLRGLETSCRDRLLKLMAKSGQQGNVTQCYPSVQYVRHALKVAGIEPVPGSLYLADDGQRPQLTADLRAQLGAVGYQDLPDRAFKGGLLAMLVDFWVLVTAPIFLPNQASSLSMNARNKRLHAQHKYFPDTAGCYGWLDLVQDADATDLSFCSL